MEHCRPATDFHWYKISKAVGSVRNLGPELVKLLPGASAVDERTSRWLSMLMEGNWSVAQPFHE